MTVIYKGVEKPAFTYGGEYELVRQVCPWAVVLIGDDGCEHYENPYCLEFCE